MNNSDYEYRDLMASSWDFFRGDPSAFADRQFYHDQVRSSGEPVLDVGCGTGSPRNQPQKKMLPSVS